MNTTPAIRNTARSRRQRVDNLIISIWPMIVFSITVICLLMIQGARTTEYEATIINLEEQVKVAQEHNAELQTLLDKSAQLVDEMSTRILELENQNIVLEEKINSLQEQFNQTTVTPVANVDKHTDLAVQTVMTTDRMNYIIDQWTEREGGNCRFVDHGQAFIDASKITGIDPVAILALSAHESGFGTSKIARTKNNFMGIGAFDASPYASSYDMGDNISQGIIQGAVWVADNYYNQGQTTLHKMIYGGKTYSTSKDKWIDDIVWLWNKSYTI